MLREQKAHEEANGTTKRLEALLLVTDTALTYLALDDLLRELLKRVREIMNVDNVAILLMTGDRQTLIPRAVLGVEEEVASQVRVPIGRGFAGTIATRAEPVVIEHVANAEVVTPLLHEKLQSLLGVPLLIEGRVIGVIHIGTIGAHRFTGDEIQLLQRVADRIALAIAQSRLYEAEQRARAEVVARAAQLETIIETMVDGVFIYDIEGQLVQTNKAARELLSLDELSEVAKQSAPERIEMLKLRDEDGVPLQLDQMPTMRILHGEVLKGVDVLMQSLDGRNLRINASGAPVYDASHQIIGGVMVVRDVTLRRDIEMRAHDVLNALLNMAEEMVRIPGDASLDGEMRDETTVVRRLVDLTCRVLGCDRVGLVVIDPETEIIRSTTIVGLAAEQEEQWNRERHKRESSLKNSTSPFIAALRANETLLVNMREAPFDPYWKQFGAHFVLFVPMLLRGQLVGILSLDHGGQDYQYAREEIALAETVAKLSTLVIERERLQREREETRANELALRESRLRMDQFLSMASHELRTPLTTIKGNVQLSKRELKRMADRERRADEFDNKIDLIHELLERADSQVGFLNRLISDLLDASRISAGMLRLDIPSKPCNLVDIAWRAVQHQRQLMPKRVVSLDISAEAKILVMGDAERLEQVITHYLINALKFSAADRPVDLSVDMQGNLARLSVRDGGPGLSLAEQSRIWEQFYRVPGINIQSGSSVGLGLGLYICRSIIELHNGQVSVSSIPGVGSTFWFTLSLASKISDEENEIRRARRL